MFAFTRKMKQKKIIFKDYFTPEITNILCQNEELYYTLESLYVSKVGLIMLGLLLDLEIKNHEEGTVITDGKATDIFIDYQITPFSLTIDHLSHEKQMIEQGYEKLITLFPEITLDKKSKKLGYPSGAYNYILEKFTNETANGGDFAMEKFVKLINNSDAKVLARRKDNYSEGRDIIYGAVSRSVANILYSRCYHDVYPSLRDGKVYANIKNSLAEEFNLLGLPRKQLVYYLSGQEVPVENSGFWEYVRQMQRIKDCPQMW